MMKKQHHVLILFVLLCSLLTGCMESAPSLSYEDFADIPPFSGEPYVLLQDNEPSFTAEELTEEAFEEYGELDALNRCTTAYANVGLETMPTEKRGSIGQVKPTGWQTAKYDFVDGKYLYNRCHLIGYQLTAENANECNLITGTRYLNVEGMLPFENLIADYVKETGNHVLYRVTPIFVESELVARGVEMEALSVEDNGEGVSFHVYAYNHQPGVVIDYATGFSATEEAGLTDSDPQESTGQEQTYILNTKSHKFHLPDCSGISSMSESNKEEFHGSRDTLIQEGYEPCGQCKP